MIYTLSTHYLHIIYTLSTLIYILSALCRQLCSRVFRLPIRRPASITRSCDRAAALQAQGLDLPTFPVSGGVYTAQQNCSPATSPLFDVYTTTK